ncbi:MULTISPECIES: OmpH family outer membrane protein [unclassified Novosphingobium]|uniref:OmpH family outer membrane protein n=1 Tax=unclassified Novosphingobium TaxID=2644732 RepID=UPI0025DDCDAF|nr:MULTISPECIES: OmpH family outer membrane protein [unclassified Novosphingobium]HQV02894.1 OmpH family outer membrane protein [Novosphingobium sp.]
MTKMFKALCGTALALALVSPAVAQKKPAPTAAAPAAAPSGPIVPGLGVANLDAAVANSNAYQVAAQQRQVTYKATYDQAQARATQIDAELKALVDKFNADKTAKKPDAILQQDYQAIQQRQERGKQELQQILMPVMMSEAYVNEQITEKLDAAVQGAMAKKGVTILLQPDTVIARANAYELTPAIIGELNTMLPTANLVPPQGWVPRQVREQQAAQQQQGRPAAAPAAGAPGTAPAPRPAGPQPDGR